MPLQKSDFRLSGAIIKVYLSALMFTMLAVLIPWDAMEGVKYVDLINYVERMVQIYNAPDSEANIIIAGFTSILTSEPTWFFLLREAVSQNIEPLFFLKLVSIFSAFVFGVFSAIRIGPVLGPLMLFNPPIIDLLNSQARGSLAISCVLLALLLLHKKRYHILVMVSAASIHTAMIVVAIFYGLASKFSTFSIRFEPKHSLPLLVVLMSVGIFSYGLENTLLYLGDRRTNTLGGGKTLLYILPWFGFYTIYLVGIKERDYRNHFYQFTVLFMGFILAAEATGGALFRLVTSCLPIFLSCLKYLQQFYFTLFVILFLMNNILLFKYWFGA